MRLQHAEQIENEKFRLQNVQLETKRRLDALRDENAHLKASLETLNLQHKKTSAQHQLLQETMASVAKERDGLQQSLAELKTNYADAAQELRAVRQSSHFYQSEYEKLLHDVQTQQHSLSSEQLALKNTQSYNGELKKQVQQLQTDVSTKHKALHAVETRLDQEKMAHKTLQTQHNLVQDELLRARDLARGLESSAAQLKDQLLQAERQLTDKAQKIESLAMLMEQVESSRDQMAFKVKQLQQQLERSVRFFCVCGSSSIN